MILDLDGCVWVGSVPTPRARDAVAALRTAGKRVAFVTNDPRHPTEEYVRKLWSLGIQASLDDVVTSGAAMQHRLAQTRQGRSAFVIGTPALRDHVADAGLRVLNGTSQASSAEVVVLGGTDRFGFEDLRDASLSLRAGADFVATGRDPTYPTEEGEIPGTGALLAAVEVASGRVAEIVGKPETQLFETALDRLGPGRTLVVGDRLDVDVEAANRAGLDSALVLTGGSTAEEADAAPEPRPKTVSPSLGELVLGA